MPRYDVPHEMELKAGFVEPIAKIFAMVQVVWLHAATEAAQCKAIWDLEDSKASFAWADSSLADSSELL